MPYALCASAGRFAAVCVWSLIRKITLEAAGGLQI
jgi:hypothetical protein